MKMQLPTISTRAQSITNRGELEKYIVESFAGSSQVKFSALVEHRMYGGKMIGWWDPTTKTGQIFGDHLHEAKEESKKEGVVKPLTTEGDNPNATVTPLSEAHAYAFLAEGDDSDDSDSLDEGVLEGDHAYAGLF